MKATDPDGLGDLTPQKLLGKPVETMVVNKATVVPEIEVPNVPAPHGSAPKNNGLPIVTTEKKADTMLPSITNRVENLFTKDNVKPGVTHDTKRVINPVADKQAADKKAAEQKQAAEDKKKTEVAKPAEDLPPATLPEPKSVKIASAPPAPKLTAKPDSAGNKLPSLDAITGDKPVPSSMDVIEPKDGISASDTMPPALSTLPPPIPPSVKVEPKTVPVKVTPEVSKPLDTAPKKTVEKVEPVKPKMIAPKPDIREDKIAALPPLPDFGAGTKKIDPALAPALPQLPPPVKPEVKKPEPAKAPAPAVTKTETVPEVKATAPKAVEPMKPAATPSGKAQESATVSFTKDATDLSADAKHNLMGIADDIKSNDSTVRIVAYAKGSEDEASIARRVSLSRALAVRAFLISKGVNQLKINVQAQGHKVPSGNPDRADVMVY